VKIADARTMRAVDRRAVSRYGLRGLQLMENAGRGVARVVAAKLRGPARGRTPARVAIIAGKGNNGGDGFVAARHLHNMGVEVSVLSLAPLSAIKGDARVNARTWVKMGGEVRVINDGRALKEAASMLRHSAVVVDGIFGTGLATPVKGVHADVIEAVNALPGKVVAIDVPSGIDSTTGAVLGVAIKADVTVTMAMPKLGLYLYPGRAHAGRIEVVDIGVPRALLEDSAFRWNLVTRGYVSSVLRPRRPESHKGTYGHVLVVGGSPGKTGAAAMAAMGAMRAGAGLATIALPAGLNSAMEGKTIEVMTAPLPETPSGTLGAVSYAELAEVMQKKSSLVVGPGLGDPEQTAPLVVSIVKGSTLPMVIDADALNALALKNRLGTLKKGAPSVLTPHPGEMSRLLKTGVETIQADRVGAAVSLAKKTGATVVLKGAATVVAAPGGETYINHTGNAGLASAGTGDVLSGVIGGLLAQGCSTLHAAVAAVYIHGLAADELKRECGEAGMVATDILARLPATINALLAARDTVEG